MEIGELVKILIEESVVIAQNISSDVNDPSCKAWYELLRVARLGAAVEADDYYRCSGCLKYFPNAPAKKLPQEHADMDTRSVYNYDLSYCSDGCASKHKDYIST